MNPHVIKNLPLNFQLIEDRESFNLIEFNDNLTFESVVNTFKRGASFESTTNFVMNWIDGFTEVEFNYY